MTNDELAEWLNRAVGLSRSKRITRNVIRQWVSWKVLPASTAKGRSRGLNPEWTRSGLAIRHALRLAELRKQGVTRKSAIVLRAFLEWGHSDLTSVRLALTTEFQRGRNRLIHSKITFMKGARFDDLSTATAKAIAHQNGSLDIRFVGSSLEQSPEFYAVISEFAYNGEQNLGHIVNLVMLALKKAFPPVTEVISKEQVRQVINANAGLIGAAEETMNAVEDEISKIVDSRLYKVRRIIRLSMILYRILHRYKNQL